VTPPRASARAAPTARALVWAGTLALPRGAVRARYRREHHAELAALCAREQIRYAAGVLCTAPALSRAVAPRFARPVGGHPVKHRLVVLAVALAVALGVAAVVAGGADDSPGLQLLGVLLAVGALVGGRRIARRTG
jgi:hypothetical protein